MSARDDAINSYRYESTFPLIMMDRSPLAHGLGSKLEIWGPEGRSLADRTLMGLSDAEIKDGSMISPEALEAISKEPERADLMSVVPDASLFGKNLLGLLVLAGAAYWWLKA